MAFTKSNLASFALRDAQIPENSSTSSVQALADAKNYIDEAALDVYSRRIWPEYIILGTASVAVSDPDIALSDITAVSPFNTAANGRGSSFATVTGVRSGSDPLYAVDVHSLNALSPLAWSQATNPLTFWPRGTSGIYLTGGGLTQAATLSFIGKATFQVLGDSESWILEPQGKALQIYATAKLIKFNDRDDGRHQALMQDFENEIQKLIDKIEVQSATDRRVIPLIPWTADQWNISITSLTGSGNNLL